MKQHFELKKQKYVGKPFKKILNHIKIYPQSFYSNYTDCYSDTQFWFTPKTLGSKTKMIITWENAYGLERNIDEAKGLFDKVTKEQYEDNIIKDINIVYSEGLYIRTNDMFRPPKDAYLYLKEKIESNKGKFIEQRFDKFLCEIIISPQKIYKGSLNQRKVYTSRFLIQENVILEILWRVPLLRRDVEYLVNKNQSYFTNDEKRFYGSKIIKDIRAIKL
ncbi:MAG TPA: hypothetical protein DCP54_04375 [Chryseobacterium sp.]|nr:hypothetical protein [Chryseobacterium sp.]